MICAVNEKNESNWTPSTITEDWQQQWQWQRTVVSSWEQFYHMCSIYPIDPVVSMPLRLDYLISIDYSLDVTFHYYCHIRFNYSSVFTVCCHFSWLSLSITLQMNDVGAKFSAFQRNIFEWLTHKWTKLTHDVLLSSIQHYSSDVNTKYVIHIYSAMPWNRFSHWCKAINFSPLECKDSCAWDYTNPFSAQRKRLISVCLPIFVCVFGENFPVWLICSATRGSFVKSKLRWISALIGIPKLLSRKLTRFFTPFAFS